jgi:excisionase family DNA binding protein
MEGSCGYPNFSCNRQGQRCCVQARWRSDQGRSAGRTGSRNQIDPRHPPRPERGATTGANVACLRGLRCHNDRDKRHLREPLVGVLGMRKVGVKMIEPNNSLAEALAAILKSIIRDAVHEALASAGGRTEQGATHDRAFLTVKQAAETSGLGASTIRLAIRKRHLRAQRVGRRVLVKRLDLESFLQANPIKAIND